MKALLKRIVVAATLLLGAGAVRPAVAQVTTADSAAVLLGAANQLRAEGRNSLSTELLELIVRRFPGTPAALEARRLLDLRPRRVVEDRPGRTELLVWSTLYGAALGAAVPAAFEADEPAIYGLGLIAGAPAGFFAARAMTGSRFVSEGQARAITFGGLWGAWQGFGWMMVLGGEERCTTVDWEPQRYCYHDDPDAEGLLRTTIIGSLAGVGTGLVLSRKPIESGVATTVNFGALWGTWFGTVATVLANDNNENDDLLLPLIGGDAGLIATALLAPKWKLSRNRARLISISGLAGALAGAGLILIVEADTEKAILLPAAGSVAGLAAGTYWTRNYDEVRRTGGDNGGGDALLNIEGRKLALDVPAPSLTFIPADAAGRTRAPALHVPLLKARF